MLQLLDDLLEEHISTIFIKSLKSGEVPFDGYKATICPMFKTGTTTDLAKNYSVSLTSVLCKIFEKLLKKCLLLILTETRPFSRNALIMFALQGERATRLKGRRTHGRVGLPRFCKVSIEPCLIGLNLTFSVEHTRSKSSAFFLKWLHAAVASPKVKLLALN